METEYAGLRIHSLQVTSCNCSRQLRPQELMFTWHANSQLKRAIVLLKLAGAAGNLQETPGIGKPKGAQTHHTQCGCRRHPELSIHISAGAGPQQFGSPKLPAPHTLARRQNKHCSTELGHETAGRCPAASSQAAHPGVSERYAQGPGTRSPNAQSPPYAPPPNPRNSPPPCAKQASEPSLVSSSSLGTSNRSNLTPT